MPQQNKAANGAADRSVEGVAEEEADETAEEETAQALDGSVDGAAEGAAKIIICNRQKTNNNINMPFSCCAPNQSGRTPSVDSGEISFDIHTD